jgi:CheY-like chemotaxis protein
MYNKSFLSGVPELNTGGKLNSMNDSQFGSYIQTLNQFIDQFPSQTRKMRSALTAKDYSGLNGIILNVCDTLAKIYATDLAVRYRRKTISEIQSGDHNKIAAFTEQFIVEISSLSIKVQMAVHKSKNALPSQTVVAPVKKTSDKACILAVDNALMFLNFLEQHLAHAYDLHCVSSGREALQFLANNRADLILSDVEMPEMDGYELTRKIKQQGIKTPIIFVTANSEREDIDKAVKAGAADLLMKPFMPNQLLAKVREFI